MTKEEAEAKLAELANHFGIGKPGLDWKPRSRNGRYFQLPVVVQIGPKAWRGPMNALVHEFAHHLVFIRERKAGHGSCFRKALKEVVRAAEWMYEHHYDWTTEYKFLRRLGE